MRNLKQEMDNGLLSQRDKTLTLVSGCVGHATLFSCMLITARCLTAGRGYD